MEEVIIVNSTKELRKLLDSMPDNVVMDVLLGEEEQDGKEKCV